jgi:lysophospholipase L1-like esterase
MKTYSYLALGDSYTIGEGVPIHETFPYQAVQLLRRLGHGFHAPEIIAKTAWTTEELSAAIQQTVLQPPYDWVSLLIGVNNQYRGRSLKEYGTEFEGLLKKAIELAGNQNRHVVVLSIPDWGVTPFASGRDQKKISAEIDAFNNANKRIAEKYDVHYIDITPGTRESANDATMLVDDKLHPSGKEYYRWASKIADIIVKDINMLLSGFISAAELFNNL